jgi:glycosyltransferase involved in cell wall biosynthesis
MKLEDRVFFLGLRDDVYFLMRSADLNILVSNFEGVSGVVLESLASGKPFCGSNVSGIKEFVPNNEFLFDSNDSKLISEKILRIKNSVKLQKYMVAQSDLFIGNFSHEISAEKINQLYNEL